MCSAFRVLGFRVLGGLDFLQGVLMVRSLGFRVLGFQGLYPEAPW